MIAMNARKAGFEPNGELGAKWSVALPIAQHLLRGRSALPPMPSPTWNRILPRAPHLAVTLVMLHEVDELFPSPV